MDLSKGDFMFYLDNDRLKYLSKLFGDMGKNIMTVAFASYFFEKFSLPARLIICIIALILMILGLLIQPAKKGV
jgi:hypothetical protein